MVKYIANIITGLRILCSVLMLFFPILSIGFYIFYSICGISDMIDGTIARKTIAVSDFGAKLDTIADFIFFVIAFIKFVPVINIPPWLWFWIMAIAIIKIGNIVLGVLQKKKFVSLHTKMNKNVGFVLFVLPFTLTFIEQIYSFTVVCILATISAFMETYYILKGNTE